MSATRSQEQIAHYRIECSTKECVVTRIPGVFLHAKSTEDVPAGTVIFEEGSSGSTMYGLIEGSVELRTAGGAVYTVSPEETFGEMALIDQKPRMATAIATSDSKLASIDQATFLLLVHETPMFALQVMGSMAERRRQVG
jgi:CRP/FNR family transcriptional regulator, cyclic AMP receptor protein